MAALATIKQSRSGSSKNFLNLGGMLHLIFSKHTSSNFCGRKFAIKFSKLNGLFGDEQRILIFLLSKVKVFF
jgi:hypothetical protein